MGCSLVQFKAEAGRACVLLQLAALLSLPRLAATLHIAPLLRHLLRLHRHPFSTPLKKNTEINRSCSQDSPPVPPESLQLLLRGERVGEARDHNISTNPHNQLMACSVKMGVTKSRAVDMLQVKRLSAFPDD